MASVTTVARRQSAADYCFRAQAVHLSTVLSRTLAQAFLAGHAETQPANFALILAKGQTWQLAPQPTLAGLPSEELSNWRAENNSPFAPSTICHGTVAST